MKVTQSVILSVSNRSKLREPPGKLRTEFRRRSSALTRFEMSDSDFEERMAGVSAPFVLLRAGEGDCLPFPCGGWRASPFPLSESGGGGEEDEGG